MDVGLGEPVFFTALQTGVKVRASKLIVSRRLPFENDPARALAVGPGARLILRGYCKPCAPIRGALRNRRFGCNQAIKPARHASSRSALSAR